MLEDRDYMRQADYRPWRVSMTVALLIVNATVFLGQILASHSVRAAEFQGTYLALSLDGIKHGYVWELLTFQFMHAGWMHLIFNSLAIYFFGRYIEIIIGSKKFLTLYLLSGVIGGLVQVLLAFLFPMFGGYVVGASAGGFGLVGAFAVMKWQEAFTLYVYFIPVTMRGRTLFWGSIAIAVLAMAFSNDGVANGAHLGGIVTGFFFARYFIHGNWVPPATHPSVERKSFWQRAPKVKKNDPDLSAEEFLQREVDPILEKISAHGIQSLTTREREILEKARSKMDRRR